MCTSAAKGAPLLGAEGLPFSLSPSQFWRTRSVSYFAVVSAFVVSMTILLALIFVTITSSFGNRIKTDIYKPVHSFVFMLKCILIA